MSYSGSAKAREARELLGRALAIVQLDPAIPPEAAPVSAFMAQAVGSLFVAEMAPNDAAGLSAVRGSLGLLGQALAQIQQVPGPVPALEAAMGTMAHAMGVLFPLTTLGEPAPIAPQPAPAPVAPQPAPAPVVQQPVSAPPHEARPAAFDAAPPRGGKSTLIFAEIGSPEISITASGGAAIPYAEASVAQSAVPQAGSRPASAYTPVSSQPSAPAYVPSPEPARPTPEAARSQPDHAVPQASQHYPATPEPHAPQSYASPPPAERQVAHAQPARVPTPLPAVPTRPYEAPPAVSIDGRPKVEVNVGARTSSNFWVGFDDEVGHGGVFFATYETAPLGSPVALFVTLPAGASFTTAARVRFVRELSDGASTPGLGFAFEGLAHEHRELVRRFAERREPLFFDEG